MTQHPRPTSPAARRVPALGALLVVLALVLSGCGWFSGGDDETPVARATPAPVEQPDPDVEVIGADDVEVGEPTSADDPGQGLYFVSSLYELTGPAPTQPLLVRMVLSNAVPDGTPLAVATRADDDAPWSLLEARLDTDGRHVEFIASELGTVGVLALDASGVAGSLGERVGTALERDAARPEGVVAPTCDAADAVTEEGYSAESWKRRTVLWCVGQLGDDRVMRLTNATGVPVHVTAPGVLDRGETGEASRAGVPYDAWLAAVAAAPAREDAEVVTDGTDAFLAPGRTLSLDVDLEPGTTLLVTAGDDARTRSVQLLHAVARGLSAQVAAFGIVEKSAVPAPGRVLRTWLSTPRCAVALGGDTRALLRGCLAERPVTRAYGDVARFLVPVLAERSTRAMLRERLVGLQERADRLEQRLEVAREELDFGRLVGSFAGTDRTLTVDATGLVTERFGRDGTPVAVLTYQLSEPNAEGTRATATLTAVEVRAPRLVGGPAPRIGQTGTLSITRGVVTPPYLRTSYCNAERAAQGRCTDAPPEPEAAEVTKDDEDTPAGPEEGDR